MRGILPALALTTSLLNSGGLLTKLNDAGLAGLDRNPGLLKVSLAETNFERGPNGGLAGTPAGLLKPGDLLKSYPTFTLFG